MAAFWKASMMTLLTLQCGSIIPILLVFLSGSKSSLCYDGIFSEVLNVECGLAHLVNQHPHGYAVQVEPVQKVLDCHVCLFVHLMRVS